MPGNRQTNAEGGSPLARATLGELVSAIAERSPAPGGGAVVGAVGALAAALGGMVVAFSNRQMDERAHAAASSALQAGADRLLELADQDARAYAELNRIQRLESDDPERSMHADAARAATRVPLDAIAESARVLGVLEGLVGSSNAWLRSDLAIASLLTEAAARSAWWNVQINLPSLESAGVPRDEASAMQSEADAGLRGLRERVEAIQNACRDGW
jgi:formiminotetrahydrofolate cyclodeaminase